MKKIRNLLWRILGFDYQTMLHKNDFVLLKNDKFTKKGKETYDNGAKVWRWTDAQLVIGNYCSIAHNVNFIVDEGFHNLSQITSYPLINHLSTDADLTEIRDSLAQKKGIFIGNDVWIGLNSIILPGLKIGNGASIAAGSVVTRDVPDYALVGGSPAKIIRMKYDQETIEKLLSISWWDWNIEEINRKKKDFYLPIEEFIRKYS